MPEGDTIHRIAAALRPVLDGQTLIACTCELAAVDDWQIAGRRVVRVEARGKNLLIHCAPLVALAAEGEIARRADQLPVAIWTHLGMNGRWSIRPAGNVALGSGPRPSLALHTQTHAAICRQPEILKFLGPQGLLRSRMLAQLGPDLLDPGADLDEAVARLRALGEVALGDAIMRQSAVAGIGNVYKSELLFLDRRDPFAPVAALEAAELRALLERARDLMRLNLNRGGPRRTRFEGRARLWVYKRSGRPCRECGKSIEMRRQGRLARSTYYCPRCQKHTAS
ncbi:Formamidopyrimidine-DNA glycosylase [Enhygromyxa salina]|uniref:DNA-(apurinic or apyrimidinic site) lyase n=1 Tax=Enhygromyxa salina TaxID=215803 RepID=A0A0C1Z4F0_9BACT|nr:DNA-formamidopyrimidine glycosylase family protein [Enhygromyxa salina]KIG12549.1 Formamidopyrimidine-DNA glycosylase [Enhygromyxa salina]